MESQLDSTQTDNEVVVQPDLTFQFELDPTRGDQLGLPWRKHDIIQTSPKPYDSELQQLISEGALFNSFFRARLDRVAFGKFKSYPGCFIMIRFDFTPQVNGSLLRWRDAVIEVEFNDGTNSSNTTTPADTTYQGPRVVKFFPEIIHGMTQTAEEEHGFEFAVDANLAPVNIGPKWSFTHKAQKNSQRILHGSIPDEDQRVVEWRILENNIIKNGVPELFKFAVVVRHSVDRPFNVTVRIKATTFANIPVRTKPVPPICFDPSASSPLRDNSAHSQDPKPVRMAGLFAEAIAIGKQAFVPAESHASAMGKEVDLDNEDLKEQTQTERMLLGEVGFKPPS